MEINATDGSADVIDEEITLTSGFAASSTAAVVAGTIDAITLLVEFVQQPSLQETVLFKIFFGYESTALP